MLVVGRQVEGERSAEIAGLRAHVGRHPLEQGGEHRRGAVQVLGKQERQAVLRDEDAAVLQCALAVGEELARVQHGARPDRLGAVDDDGVEPLVGLGDVFAGRRR